VLKEVEEGLIPEERFASCHRLTEELIFQSKKPKSG
jgi:ribosome biogenesis GTPase